jgi:hypothetical protein
MNKFPNHFKKCNIVISAEILGTIGVVKGILFHYPCWIGILEPSVTFDSYKKELVNKLEKGDLDIHLHDLVSDETWQGKMSDLSLPSNVSPWHEIKWYDDKPRK